jgi:hypothetical protein
VARQCAAAIAAESAMTCAWWCRTIQVAASMPYAATANRTVIDEMITISD